MIFSEFAIKNMALKNRFVRSATFEGAGESNGEVSPLEIGMYRDLAKGEVGLIISGVTCVHEKGRLFNSQNCLSGDTAIPGMARLAKAVHDQGGKLAVQLFHAGREGSRFLPKDGLAPSLVKDDPHFGLSHRAMTEEEIWEVVEAFGHAAARAKEAGCDAVQLHGAHAYLLAQFLSPHTNRRRDHWGGDLYARTKLHREILANIRKQVGMNYPVMIKLGVRDGFDGGLPLEQGLEAAAILAQAGFDCLEISQGLRGAEYHETEFRTNLKSAKERAYFREWAAEVKRRVNVPVMAVGGIRDLETAEDILQKGDADLISLSRPLISEPGLVARWRKGDIRPARCISCNKCIDELLAMRPITCVLDKAKGTNR
ncbi:MAG: NADH:flavin oxidoreductase [Desulfobacteraceae bacterium]|nr:MAG: NADH:flavin oxidoreductase [Desulfobacteraceae bacterium]